MSMTITYNLFHPAVVDISFLRHCILEYRSDETNNYDEMKFRQDRYAYAYDALMTAKQSIELEECPAIKMI